MKAIAMYYDPELWYKNNLNFNFMNFNENLRNLREKVKNLYGLTYKMTCISAIKSPIVLKMVSNGGYGNIIPAASCTTVFKSFDFLFEEY